MRFFSALYILGSAYSVRRLLLLLMTMTMVDVVNMMIIMVAVMVIMGDEHFSLCIDESMYRIFQIVPYSFSHLSLDNERE